MVFYYRKLIDSESELLIKPYEAIIFRANGAGLASSVGVLLVVALVLLNVLLL